MMERNRPRQASWSLEGLLGAGGARALLAGVGAAGVMLSIPGDMLGRGIDSAGLGEVLPLIAPPLSLAVRAGLAVIVAALTAAAVLFAWRATAGEPALPQQPAMPKGHSDMDEVDETPGRAPSKPANAKKKRPAKKLGWSSRLAGLLGLRRKKNKPSSEALVRRRADRHPDAPARPPLMASRDLPPHGENDAGNGLPDQAPGAARTPPTAFHVLDDEKAENRFSASWSPDLEGREDAPHRSRWALPDEGDDGALAPDSSEVAPVAESVDGGPDVAFPAQPFAAQPFAAQPVAESKVEGLRSELTALPPIEDESIVHGMTLTEMLDRFERGLSRSIALMDAHEAEAQLSERFVFVQSDPAVRDALRLLRPVDPVPQARRDGASEENGAGDGSVDEELQRALGTLRKLTEQSRR